MSRLWPTRDAEPWRRKMKITVSDQRVWALTIQFCYKNELTGIRIDRSGYIRD